MSFIRHRRPSCRHWKFEVDIVWRCNVFFSAFYIFYWAIFEIKLFNLTKIFIKWFFHSVLMQYFWLIRGIHISTRNLVFLYQGVVKSSLIAQNYVFMTPPLTILFFRRIRPRHYSPCPNKHTLNVLKMIFQSTQKLRSLTYFTSRSIHSSKERSLRCGAICQ